MEYTSLMQLIREEHEICQKIQDRINIIDAFDQREKEGYDLSAHSAVVDKAAEELGKLFRPLHKIRAEIGGKFTMMEELAAETIRGHLMRGDRDHE